MGIFDFLSNSKNVNIKIDEQTIVTVHNKKKLNFIVQEC